VKLLNSKMKRVAAAALVVSASAAAVFLVVTPRAGAMPPQAFERAYYSDEDFQNQVGSRILECNGSRSSWGTTSARSMVIWSEGCGAPGSWTTRCYTFPPLGGQPAETVCGPSVGSFPPSR
jgi:hypothetical protein